MAYGEKYYVTFRDRRNIRWKCHVYKTGYASTVYDIKLAGDPLKFDIRPSGDVFDPIKITECTLNLVVDGTDMGGDTDENRIQEFKTAQIFDFYIKVEKETAASSGTYSTYYQGTQITDIYTEPYDQLPYNVAIKFSDLGDLAFVEFTDTTGYYKDHASFARQIYNCLKNLPFSYDLAEVVNLFPDEITEADNTSSLFSIKSNVTAYVHYDFEKKRAVGDSCLEVLRKILTSLGARLFQFEAGWYVIRINEMTSSVDSAIKFCVLEYANNYDIVISNSTTTFNKIIDNTEANGIAISQGAELSIESLVDIFIYKYKNQEPVRNGNNIIFNYQLDKGFYSPNATNSMANFWKLDTELDNADSNTAATADSDNTLYTTSGSLVSISKQSFAFLPQAIASARTAAQGGDAGQTINSYDKFFVSPYNPVTDGNTYYAQEYIQMVTADSVRLKLKGRFILRRTVTGLLNNGIFMCYQRFYISIKDAGTSTIYYLKQNSGGAYSWSTTAAAIKISKLLEVSNVAANDLHDNPFDFEFDITSLPFTGISEYIDIRVFCPIGNNYDATNDRVETAVYDEISVSYISNAQTADEIIVQEHDLTVTPQKNVEKTHEAFHGDGPFKYSLGAMFTGTSSPVLTTTWHRRDVVESITFAQTYVNTFFSIYSDYIRKLNVSIYSYLELYRRLLLNDGIIYIIDGYSFSVKESVYQTNIIEITEKTGMIIDPQAPVGIKSVPVLYPTGKLPIPKTKANGTVSSVTVTGSIIGKTTAQTYTETAGNYPG